MRPARSSGARRRPRTPRPRVANGVVYAGFWDGDNDEVQALDASTGHVLFRAVTSHHMNNPIVANGVVYAATDLGALLAFHLPPA